MSFFVVNMITMMGLALGIDYSLVMVQRFREELTHGHSVLDAVTIAGGTANRAVLFSGITVVISLLGLLLVPSTVMRSLGTGAIVVAVMAVAASLTLLPAILRLLGHRVNAGRLPLRHPDAEPRAWRAIARTVSGRPVAWAITGFAVLGLAAIPAASMRLAFPGTESLPQDNDLRIAVETLTADYSVGQATTTVAVEGGADARVAVEEIASRVSADPAFGEAIVEYLGADAMITTTDLLDGADPEAAAAIERVRDVIIPDAVAATDAVAHVGGDQAEAVDFSAVIAGAAPWVLLTVLGATLSCCWCPSGRSWCPPWPSASTCCQPPRLSASSSRSSSGAGATICWVSRRWTASRRGFRCSCSRSCSDYRWTTTCSC
ncbi:hypothetical protein GCM10025876_25430 [Demequina litorisediminis]|uniref:SSD domain-containing protein n=1 Tax=Demequina litorisediminis TaxID=1849022 RepID=A0ABQ6IEN7_9MICO|nr:hypothetical protein GCM10025876_25430 [Demequina litorisediminis]